MEDIGDFSGRQTLPSMTRKGVNGEGITLKLRVTSVHSLSKCEAMSKVLGICAFSHEYLYSMSLWKAERLSRE